MNLESISSISPIIGTATIFGGTVFGLIQLWELKKQRRDAVAGELMRSFMDAHLAEAIKLRRAGIYEARQLDSIGLRVGPKN